MALTHLIAVPNDNLPHIPDENAPFMEIHLDEQYYTGKDVALYFGTVTNQNEIEFQINTRYFGDPDECIDFITAYEWKKVFISLTDKFSYLLSMIHDIPQILYIYIYSASAEQMSYPNNMYSKLRAVVDENSPDANKPILNDIQTFQRDLMPINVTNPVKRKTKLLIQEPLPVEEYIILWIDDKDVSTDMDTKCVTDIINHLDIFFNAQHCIATIKSLSESIKIFLISSYSDTDTIVKEVAHLSNVIAIYLLHQCVQITDNLTSSTSKVVGQYSDLEALLTQLTHDYRNLRHSSPLSMTIFDREKNQSTIRDLSNESARFVWQQLLIDILIKTPYNDQSKTDMLDECRIQYKDNSSVSQSIEEFDKTYKSTEALTFYTKDSFLYRLFNQALRTENIDLLFIFRFVLADMYSQLQKLYFDQFLNNPYHADSRFIVYRGQLMKITELDQIKNNIGRLISVNVFLSTTEKYEVAVMYSGSNPNHQEPNMLTVIFEIEVNLTHDATKRPYASLKHLSQFSEEDEILLSVGSTFHIIDVQDRRTSDGHWHVKMTMVEDDDDVNELRNDLEKQYSICGNLCDLGSALVAMCDYDRAERYYRMLLEYIPEDHSTFGHIQVALGIIYANRGDYQRALQFQEQALKFYTSGDPAYHDKNEVGKVYVHIGAAYRDLGQLDLALKYCSMAANIQSPTGSLAFTYNEIAITHRAMGDNRLALEYFLKSLDIEERVSKLSKYHPKLATAYNNIGEIYIQLKDYENASRHLQYALDIRLKGTVSTHTDLAAIYHNLGSVYENKCELRKALEMHEKALEIDMRTLNEDHESLAGSHFGITNIHTLLNDFTNALYHAEKGLRILLRSQSKENRSLVARYQVTLGRVQYQLGNTTKALKCAGKALNNALACSSENQRDIACIYDLLSEIYEKEGDISKALEYIKKAVEQAKAWTMRNGTFELEYFLTRLDSVKNKSVLENSRSSTSLTLTKVWLDKVDVRDQLLLATSEALEQTPKDNVQQRLHLISLLITMYSRQKNFSMAKNYFDQANSIYAEYQSSDIITKDPLEDAMIPIFYHTALSYHRQQEWNVCLNMLSKPLNIILQHNKEHIVLPEIYYMMASCYMHQGEFATAAHYYQLAISTAEKILPDDHSDMQRYRLQFQLFTRDLSETVFKSKFYH